MLELLRPSARNSSPWCFSHSCWSALLVLAASLPHTELVVPEWINLGRPPALRQAPRLVGLVAG